MLGTPDEISRLEEYENLCVKAPSRFEEEVRTPKGVKSNASELLERLQPRNSQLVFSFNRRTRL
jgi:hypothetical protein